MNRKYLLIWTICHVVLLIVVAGLIASRTTNFNAYVLTLVFYWVSCWATIVVFRCEPDASGALRPNPKPNLVWLPIVPVVCLAIFALMKSPSIPSFPFAMLLVVAAVVNGVTEEWYWRRMYTAQFFPDRKWGLVFPCVLFTSWHLALLRIPNVVYEGGPLALLGGAAVLGVLWGIVYWFNQKFWIIAGSHVLVNVFAFAVHVSDNGWV